jgi:hypothetical protein
MQESQGQAGPQEWIQTRAYHFSSWQLVWQPCPGLFCPQGGKYVHAVAGGKVGASQPGRLLDSRERDLSDQLSFGLGPCSRPWQQ